MAEGGALPRDPDAPTVMDWADVERFLAAWCGKEHTQQAASRYRYSLRKFYESLPEGHAIGPESVRRWRDQLLESGYAPATVNLYISSCNSWLEYIGRREYQLVGQLEGPGRNRAALSRGEYHRLLLAARGQGQEKTFLIIKVFGSTGLYARELETVTVEAVRTGWMTGTENGAARRIRFPSGLRQELLAYAERQGLTEGPVFRKQNGAALERTAASGLVRRMGEEAGIEAGRATPSGLRLMYLASRAEIEADAALLVERALERQAALEQLIVGWSA